jgi:flagellar basal-body rod modification protein FlgD
MTISAITSPDASTSSPTAASSTADAGSISSLTPTDFIQMLAAELQNQDPSNPTDPSQILQQTSMIANMESETNMSTAVESEQATGLIGQTITGTNLSGQSVTGTVTDVKLDPSSGSPNLMVNGVAVPLSAVTDITSSGSSAAGTSASGTSGSAGSSGSGATGSSTS